MARNDRARDSARGGRHNCAAPDGALRRQVSDPGPRAPRVRSLVPVLLLVGVVLTACGPRAELRATAESARDAVRSVRPAADLANVRVEIWTRATDVRTLAAAETEGVTLPELATLFEAQAPVLEQLGLVTRQDVADFETAFLELGSEGIAGIAFPASGLVFVTEWAAGSLEVLAHEYGHVASARMGYGARTSQAVFPRGAGAPAFADLDALVAAWLLHEADAELTGRMAAAFAQGGRAAAEALWRERIPVEAPDLVGPASLTRPDGTRVVLEAGESYVFPKSLLETWLDLAYGGSQRLPLARHADGDDLEATLRRTWAEFTFTTREVLFPDVPTTPSRFADACADLADGITGATRVGALFVRDALERRGGLSRERALGLVRALEDDVVVRTRDGGLLWVVRWTDDAAAKKFARSYELIVANASIRADGRVVTVTVGDVPEAESLLTRLR
jgi:hypothetical protein